MKRAGKRRGPGGDRPPGRSWPLVAARNLRRQLRPTISSLAALAAALPLAAAPPAAAAQDPEPARVLTISPLWPVVPLKGALGGSLCRSDSCDPITYVPFWTSNGVTTLDRQLSDLSDNDPATDGPTVVFAYSNGAVVATEWMEKNARVPQEPSPQDLSFVLIGNPARGHGGIVPPMPPSGYQVIDVVRQYDPLADFPDNPNLLALANIAAGFLSPVHLDYRNVDIDDPANITWTEGTTTYVFVPTEYLPVLDPLRMIGMGWLADELNEPLKEIVERAYDRPYLATAPTDQPDVPSVEPPSSEPAGTDPADAPPVGEGDEASAPTTVGDGDDATAGTTGEPPAPVAAAVESPDELADVTPPGYPTDTATEDAAPDDAPTANDTFEGDTDAQTASDEPAPVDVAPEQSADTQADSQQTASQESSDTDGE